MSVADELTKLVALRDSGVITPEEFDQQRAILLATPSTPAAIPEPAPARPVQWGPTDAAPYGSTCGRCGKALSPAWRGKCNHCGASYAQFPPVGAGGAVAPQVALPPPASAIPPPASKRKLVLVFLGILAVLVVVGAAFGSRGGKGAAPTSRPATTIAPVAKQLVGTFVEWVPVDEANGYAYITIKNNGTTTVTAECTVSVRNEFGNFGFDSLVGEEIAPGETFSGRMAISVSEGSFLINEGEVKDC